MSQLARLTAEGLAPRLRWKGSIAHPQPRLIDELFIFHMTENQLSHEKGKGM